MDLIQICYKQTYNQEELENKLFFLRKSKMCSALSVLGFRIGGRPQNLDYGGGDKSGLGPGSPFPLFAPVQQEENYPV